MKGCLSCEEVYCLGLFQSNGCIAYKGDPRERWISFGTKEREIMDRFRRITAIEGEVTRKSDRRGGNQREYFRIKSRDPLFEEIYDEGKKCKKEALQIAVVVNEKEFIKGLLDGDCVSLGNTPEIVTLDKDLADIIMSFMDKYKPLLLVEGSKYILRFVSFNEMVVDIYNGEIPDKFKRYFE